MNDVLSERKPIAPDGPLTSLGLQADELRTQFERLRQEVAAAGPHLAGAQTTQLLRANEQLTVAALQARALAETAVSQLDEMARSTHRDRLTDTPSRALMLEHMQRAFAMARRRGVRSAMLLLDLDDFKAINLACGNSGGDEVLKLVARRLESVVRGSDTISRWGGDEFLVLLAEIAQPSDAGLVARKLLSALAAPSRVNEHALVVTASVGIAVFPDDGEDGPTLIGRADAAMYRSKKFGPGGTQFHAEAPDQDSDGDCVPGAIAERKARPPDPAHADPWDRLLRLREANQQLVIAALSAQEMEADAEEAHRRHLRFFAMVAHELQNPLVPIRTASELLSRVTSADPLLGQLRRIIEDGVTHVSRLARDLLDGARVGAGTFRLDCSSVDLAVVLDFAIASCAPAIASRFQRFAKEIPSHPLKVHGDPVRLAQVFSNLLDNASKYTPDGGEITLTVTVLERAFAIVVSDNGAGISAAALPDVFDLFVQDTRTLTMRNGGLGIGLAVVRELVEAHGGSVVGKSEGIDRGSEFVVTLPADGHRPGSRALE